MLVLIKDGENRGKTKARRGHKDVLGFHTMQPEVKDGEKAEGRWVDVECSKKGQGERSVKGSPDWG